MSKILVKANGPQVGMNVGSGGPGIAFMVGNEKVMNPSSKEFISLYGQEGSPSHDRAMRMQNLGRMGRYGLAGLSAFNSAYNQTSSGQPGVIGAAGSGAMQGFYGSAGLEDFAARAGQKHGKKLGREKPVNTTALVPTNIASPTQSEPIDVEFTEEEHGDEQRLLAPPTANMTGSVGVRNPYSAMMDEYGRPKNPYDAMVTEYGE
jgi:hypothetical protein